MKAALRNFRGCLFWTNENFPRVSCCNWKLAKGRWMLAATVIAGLHFHKMIHYFETVIFNQW